jgi:hypothetical protein
MEESRTVLSLVITTLELLAAASLGLSLGVMLTGSFVLVPYWRSLPPTEFLAWFATNAQRMAGLAGAVQLASVVFAVAAALLAGSTGHADRWLVVIAALLALAVLATYFLYFQQVNASFTTATISLAEVPAELARWAVWQWIRIGFGVGAFVAALLALRRFG